MHWLKKALYSCCLIVLLGAAAGCKDDDPGTAIRFDAAISDARAAGEFLAPCTTSDDCILGLCVDIAGEKRCSKPCANEDACPTLSGWRCEQSSCRCDATASESTCATDTDCDGQPDVQPTAEICNQRDDDCNGKVDDVAAGVEGAKEYFPDEDGDGYGVTNLGVWACAKPDKHSEVGGDCEDEVFEVNPGQEEICGDTYDNDCDFALEDPDICGLAPLEVADVATGSASSLHTCDQSADVSAPFDIIEIVGSQDSSSIRFTVRLEGSPATTSCSTYKLGFGDASGADALVYLFRPGFSQCNPSLARVEAYDSQGALVSTGVDVQFNAANPGSVSFVIPRAEILSRVPDPSYWIEACTIDPANGATDLTACTTDRCAGPVHR